MRKTRPTDEHAVGVGELVSQTQRFPCLDDAARPVIEAFNFSAESPEGLMSQAKVLGVSTGRMVVELCRMAFSIGGTALTTAQVLRHATIRRLLEAKWPEYKEAARELTLNDHFVESSLDTVSSQDKRWAMSNLMRIVGLEPVPVSLSTPKPVVEKREETKAKKVDIGKRITITTDPDA